jgi:hypothetical protein
MLPKCWWRWRATLDPGHFHAKTPSVEAFDDSRRNVHFILQAMFWGVRCRRCGPLFDAVRHARSIRASGGGAAQHVGGREVSWSIRGRCQDASVAWTRSLTAAADGTNRRDGAGGLSIVSWLTYSRRSPMAARRPPDHSERPPWTVTRLQFDVVSFASDVHGTWRARLRQPQPRNQAAKTNAGSIASGAAAWITVSTSTRVPSGHNCSATFLNSDVAMRRSVHG